MKVLVPDSIPLNLPDISGIEFVKYSVEGKSFEGVQDAELLVMWMNSVENTKAAVSELKNLKLIQTLAAGPDHVLAANFDSQIRIASGRGLHDKTVAEHALALTLASVRQLDTLFDSQKKHIWNQEIISAQASQTSSQLYTLNGAQVLIYGFGSIAQHLAPMLTNLGALVSGVAQSNGVRNGYPVIASKEIEKQLGQFDLVISLLPYDLTTEKHFGEKFFSAMKDSGIFINVGRGKTVDEAALISAIKSQKIRRAAIDVTSVEPLPADSPLWELDNVIITPHIAGGRPQGAEQLIADNALATLSGEKIKNLVTR